LARVGQHLSLIMFDVDHFKLYNDTYGHGAGDDCLKRVAKAAVAALQRPADMVARYGGEEFIALLPDTSIAGAQAVAEAIRENVENEKIPHERSSTAPHVTVSLGFIATIPKPNLAIPETLEAVDKALYAAKTGGRNRVMAGEHQI
jgi:diguanylate cyclase (GGDEF)-like protein